jgi:rubrerythrin
MSQRDDVVVIRHADELWQPATRRNFLRMLGIGGSVVLLPSVFAACEKDDDITGGGGGGGGGAAAVTLNLSTDAGILNYAFALEQLEAAFYTAVVGASNFNSLFTSAEEREILADLRNHEIIHREFFRAALGSAAIGDLTLNQTTVNTALASRDSVLRTAEQFEDLGVSAYNGAGKYLTNVSNLLVAGKIVSVEARHAAVIRDLRDTTGRRFAGDDVVNAQGLDVKLEPAAVLARVAATNFVSNTITVSAGPNGTATTDAPPPTNV